MHFPVSALPPSAAWRHLGASEGFEVLFPRHDDHGIHLDGHVTVIEEGEVCGLNYFLRLDRDWTTRWARVSARTVSGEHERRIERAGDGALTVDGAPAPQLEGLVDVDLEVSAVTNALPVNRMRLAVGEAADAPAAYVRIPDLRVVRLDQTYRRIEDAEGECQRYEYESPQFGFAAVLRYDASGLIVDYPGIATRVH